MKKLVIKIIVFTVLFVAVDCAIGYLFKNIQNKVIEYPINYGNAYLKAVYAIDDDVVIVGESRAHCHFIPAIIEDSLHLSAVNVAKDGSYLSQQAAIIRMMLKRYVPKLIIWEVNPSSLMGKEHENELLSALELTPFYSTDSLSKCLINQRGIYESIKMKSNAYRYNNKLVGLLLIMYEGGYNDYQKGYNPLPTIGYIYPTKRVQNFADDVSQFNVDLLKSTLEYIHDKGCDVILVSSPQFESSNLNETRQSKVFNSLVDSLDVLYLDHRYVEQFQNDSSLYKDCSHLNENGARAYMQFFIPELKKYLEEF